MQSVFDHVDEEYLWPPENNNELTRTIRINILLEYILSLTEKKNSSKELPCLKTLKHEKQLWMFLAISLDKIPAIGQHEDQGDSATKILYI